MSATAGEACAVEEGSEFRGGAAVIAREFDTLVTQICGLVQGPGASRQHIGPGWRRVEERLEYAVQQGGEMQH